MMYDKNCSMFQKHDIPSCDDRIATTSLLPTMCM